MYLYEEMKDNCNSNNSCRLKIIIFLIVKFKNGSSIQRHFFSNMSFIFIRYSIYYSTYIIQKTITLNRFICNRTKLKKKRQSYKIEPWKGIQSLKACYSFFSNLSCYNLFFYISNKFLSVSNYIRHFSIKVIGQIVVIRRYLIKLYGSSSD